LGLVPQHLEKYGGALSGKTLSLPAAARILRPAARDAARLRRLHAQACRLAETRPKVFAHPEVARAIEQGLIHALVTCLTAKARDDGAARRHHTGIMVRFEEVLAEHPNRQLHIPGLCALIGVTERTLRSCCAEFLGIGPSHYVLLRRLKRVQIPLREADLATASVAEIASGCGFTEQGRFAGGLPDRIRRVAFNHSPTFAGNTNSRHNICRLCIVNRRTKGLGSLWPDRHRSFRGDQTMIRVTPAIADPLERRSGMLTLP
jgi:AraC-like DNA-binding protein